MPLNIRSEAVNALAGKLAMATRSTKTEAVRVALQNELRRHAKAVPLAERLQPLLKRVAAAAPTGLEADKAFYDSLEGDL